MLGLLALIACHPYDLPSHLPALLAQLVTHVNDPQPVSGAVRKGVGEFMTTHKDEWEMSFKGEVHRGAARRADIGAERTNLLCMSSRAIGCDIAAVEVRPLMLTMSDKDCAPLVSAAPQVIPLPLSLPVVLPRSRPMAHRAAVGLHGREQR